MTVLAPTEALGESALFELFEQGHELGISIYTLESLADTRMGLAVSALQAYTEIPGVTEADYPKLVDLSLSANFFRARAQKERGELSELEATARSQFVGRTALITPLAPESQPITAVYTVGTRDPRTIPRSDFGLIAKKHPARARGTVDDLALTHYQLTVQPRPLSVYRTDRGRFEVDIVDDNGNPAVKIGFADAA